jgi:putative endonuclease
MEKRAFGQSGESIATDYLTGRGYTIIEVNWRCRHGEIDIIARDASTIVFVEVRSRHSTSTETAFESITTRKRAKMIRAAQLYLAQNKLEAAEWRIDAVAVAIPKTGDPLVEHVENALDW